MALSFKENKMAVQDEVPKSRLTLTYRTEVDGEPETVNLPLRFLVMGDLSKGTSTDRKIDLEERRLRNLDGTNLAGVMKDMKMSLQFSVVNKIDPDNQENIDVDLPLDSMKAFSPDEIVKNVPKLKGLLMLKKLLVEVQSNMSNVKEFRKLLTDLYSSDEAYKKVVEEFKGFESFKLPTGEKTGGEAS